MKPTLLCLSLILVVSPAFGQGLPVDDVTKLADPKNKTVEKSPLQKNLVPEKTPSGMTIYRELPPKPPRVAAPTTMPTSTPTALTPEEAKQFREAEQRARQQNLEQSRQPVPQDPPVSSPTARLSALFDIDKHCKHIGSLATGGSYTLEQTCRNIEREAFAKLSSMAIPPEIEKHCAHIGGMATGGSYSLMQTCVEQEIEAKENLQ